MENFFLLTLSILLLINAIMVIITKNPVHSIFFLVLVFVAATGLLLLLGVEFIAMLFLVVYIGAITVLFLFVVMMLNVKIVELKERFIRYLPIGIFIGIIFLIEVIFLINEALTKESFELKNILFNNISEGNPITYNYFELISSINIEQLGNILYTKYVYLFILGGMVLLIAMIGAIVLTLNQKFRSKHQDYYTQTNRLLNQSIRHLK